MNKSIHSIALALAVLAVLSFGVSNVNAQNATNIVRDHDHDHHFGPGFLNLNHLVNPFFGVRHLGGNVVVNPPVVTTPSTTVVSPSTTTVTSATPVVRHHDFFDRYHDWAFAHHDHFLFLNNRYIVLPGFSACPAGTQLNSLTGECEVFNQVILTQQAPVIAQEQVNVDPTVVTGQTSVVGQPVLSCPQGSLVNDQCVVESQSVVAPNVSCAVGTLVGGQCVEQQQSIVVGQSCGCPVGSTANGAGQCVVNALPSQVITGSEPNEIIVLGHHFHHEGLLPWLR